MRFPGVYSQQSREQRLESHMGGQDPGTHRGDTLLLIQPLPKSWVSSLPQTSFISQSWGSKERISHPSYTPIRDKGASALRSPRGTSSLSWG